jgi:hypothetical protein
MVLFRIITVLSPNDVTLVDIVQRKLTALKLMDDPTINLRNYLTQIRDISHDLVTKQPESWKHNMFSKLAALNIMGGQPKRYEEEFPLLLHSEMTKFIKKHNSMMSDYDEFETGLEALCLKYEDYKSQDQWDPVKNTSKTKEVSMFAKLESKLNTIEKKLNGSGTSSTLAPKKSKDGKILLEAGKKYLPEEFHSLSKADKAYLAKLREQAKSSGGGGGGGNGNEGNKSKKPKQTLPKITNKDAPATPEGWRDGKDADGKATGKKEWQCSQGCGWNFSHGDKHPSKQHDPNFVPRWKKKNQKASTSSGSLSLSMTAAPGPKPKTVKFAEAIETPIESEPLPEPTTSQDDDELEPESSPFGFLFAWSDMMHPKEEGSQG